MKDQSTILVSEGLSDRIDMNQFYDRDDEVKESYLEFCISLDGKSYKFPILNVKRTIADSLVEVDFLAKASQLDTFLSNNDIDDITIGLSEDEKVFLRIKNLRIISFESSIYREDEHMCKLIVNSSNI
jgi:hypothetical protein|tara:strand:+ start:271 stop:654 length:384 start_codon:yes stop_codon:yes gene_type:complete